MLDELSSSPLAQTGDYQGLWGRASQEALERYVARIEPPPTRPSSASGEGAPALDVGSDRAAEQTGPFAPNAMLPAMLDAVAAAERKYGFYDQRLDDFGFANRWPWESLEDVENLEEAIRGARDA